MLAVAWAVVVLALLGLAREAGSAYSADLSLRGHDSDRAARLLADRFPARFRRTAPQAAPRLGVLVCAFLIFMAGMGTSTWMISNRLKDMKGALLAAGGGGLASQGGRPTARPGGEPGGQASEPGVAPGTAPGGMSDEEWAADQDLPPQALQMLRQNYPDGVPDDIRKRIKEELGGEERAAQQILGAWSSSERRRK